MVVAYVFEQVIGLLPFQAMVAEQHVRYALVKLGERLLLGRGDPDVVIERE